MELYVAKSYAFLGVKRYAFLGVLALYALYIPRSYTSLRAMRALELYLAASDAFLGATHRYELCLPWS